MMEETSQPEGFCDKPLLLGHVLGGVGGGSGKTPMLVWWYGDILGSVWCDMVGTSVTDFSI